MTPVYTFFFTASTVEDNVAATTALPTTTFFSFIIDIDVGLSVGTLGNKAVDCLDRIVGTIGQCTGCVDMKARGCFGEALERLDTTHVGAWIQSTGCLAKAVDCLDYETFGRLVK